MLFAITQKKEIRKANDMLFNRLASLKHESYIINYGSAGGSAPINISYSPEYNMWWGNSDERKANRFWNPFGQGKPKPNSTVTGRCQINYSASGINNSVGGLFAKDSSGEIYLLHSGKVGGGQKGVGKNAFADYYTGRKQPVEFDNQELDYYVITGLTSKRFFQNLYDFVNDVYEFKDYIKKNRIAGVPIREKNPLKDGEYLGIKTYDLPAKVVVASNDHAVITTQLIEELRDRGFEVHRDQFRDAYTVDAEKLIDRVFEVKSSLSRQSLYTAIGQLTLHSLIYDSKKFFVVDKGINNELVKHLMKIQITCILYF
jgi:hypothetical protein